MRGQAREDIFQEGVGAMHSSSLTGFGSSREPRVGRLAGLSEQPVFAAQGNGPYLVEQIKGAGPCTARPLPYTTLIR